MRAKTCCEASPFRDSVHQRAAALQFQVMREFKLNVWNTKEHPEAASRLHELLGADQRATTGDMTAAVLFEGAK